MNWQHWAMIVLFVIAVLLPFIGLVGVYRFSVKEAHTYKQAEPISDGAGMSFGQFDALTNSTHERMQGAPTYALRDFLLIGSGLVAGAAASIWAVVDSTH